MRGMKTPDDIGSSASRLERPTKLQTKIDKWHSSQVALRKRPLTWYMNFSERQPRATKAKIKAQFLSFFKTPDDKHLAMKKLKTTSQKPRETNCVYDNRWKYLLSHLDYVIDE